MALNIVLYSVCPMAINGKKQSANGKKRIVKFKAKFSWKNLLLYGFLIVFSLFVFSALSAPYQSQKTVPLSQIISDVKKGQVTQITVNGDKLSATEKSGEVVQAVKEPNSDVYTLFKNAGASLGSAKVDIKNDSGINNWINLTSAILPVL